MEFLRVEHLYWFHILKNGEHGVACKVTTIDFWISEIKTIHSYLSISIFIEIYQLDHLVPCNRQNKDSLILFVRCKSISEVKVRDWLWFTNGRSFYFENFSRRTHGTNHHFRYRSYHYKAFTSPVGLLLSLTRLVDLNVSNCFKSLLVYVNFRMI